MFVLLLGLLELKLMVVLRASARRAPFGGRGGWLAHGLNLHDGRFRKWAMRKSRFGISIRGVDPLSARAAKVRALMSGSIFLCERRFAGLLMASPLSRRGLSFVRDVASHFLW